MDYDGESGGRGVGGGGGGDNRDFGIPFCVRSCIHKISRENNIILHSKFCSKTYHRQTFPVLYFCTEKQDMGMIH